MLPIENLQYRYLKETSDVFEENKCPTPFAEHKIKLRDSEPVAVPLSVLTSKNNNSACIMVFANMQLVQTLDTFGKVSQQLSRLMRKNVPLTWGTEEKTPFNTLKKLLTTAFILHQADALR